MANYNLDGDKFRNTMHSLNYGNVLEAAAKNYIKDSLADEIVAAEAAGRKQLIDLEDLEEVSAST